MAITFVPDAGDVLICDFTGFVAPEMTKTRRVIVLSPRSRRIIPRTYLVVPVSRTVPVPREPCHHEFHAKSYPFFDQTQSVWVKADMVTCVAAHRLDRVKILGRFARCSLLKEDLNAVRRRVLFALGLDDRRREVR